VTEADENQWRIERYRRERIDGEPVGRAGGVENAGNGDSGGKPAAGPAEFFAVDRLFAHFAPVA